MQSASTEKALQMQATKTHLIHTQAATPLLQRNAMIVVRVARLQERCDTMLQRHQWRPNREQLVTRHRSIVRLSVQIAPLPHRRVRPTARLVRLRFLLHQLIVVGQFVALGQITHHRVQPFAHSPREVAHLFRRAIGLFAALSVVIDVHVLELGSLAGRVVHVAEASLAVHLAGRVPGGVVIGADQTPGIVVLGALGHADARRFVLFDLADATGSAFDARARINCVRFFLF